MVTSTRGSSRGKEEKLAIAVVALVVTSTRISSRGGEEDLYTKKTKFEFACFVVFLATLLCH